MYTESGESDNPILDKRLEISSQTAPLGREDMSAFVCVLECVPWSAMKREPHFGVVCGNGLLFPSPRGLRSGAPDSGKG